ncbi:hypothetical protein [Streptomyces sp. H72]
MKPPPGDERSAAWDVVTVVCDTTDHEEPDEAVVHCGPIIVDDEFRGVHYWGPGYQPPYV